MSAFVFLILQSDPKKLSTYTSPATKSSVQLRPTWMELTQTNWGQSVV